MSYPRPQMPSQSGSSVGLFELLTVVFVVLKLTGLIDWSWWWVLSPILIPIGIAILIWVLT